VDAVIATQPLHRLPFTVHHRRSFTNHSYHNHHQNDRPANVTAAKHAIKTYVLATFETAWQNSIAHLLLILMRRWNNWHQPLPGSFLCAGGRKGGFFAPGGRGFFAPGEFDFFVSLGFACCDVPAPQLCLLLSCKLIAAFSSTKRDFPDFLRPCKRWLLWCASLLRSPRLWIDSD
jgi:hypothetical protein